MREIGQGSGLGLSMVYGFARQSNGFLLIDSLIGVGTAVSIYMPVAAATSAVDATPERDIVRPDEQLNGHGQTVLVVGWIAVNAAAVAMRWDPYPFNLVNLMFSLQAAYAAPLILLAQTRQADRDKALSESDAGHREALAAAAAERQGIANRQAHDLRTLLEANTRLTEQIDRLTREIHGKVVIPRQG